MGSIGEYAKGEHPVFKPFKEAINEWNKKCGEEYFAIPWYKRIILKAVANKMTKYGFRLQDWCYGEKRSKNGGRV